VCKKFKNTAKSSRIRKAIPFEKGGDNRVGAQDNQLVDMSGSGQYAEHHHHNNIGDWIQSIVATFDIDCAPEYVSQAEFFGKAPDVNEPGVAGEVFFVKSGVEFTHQFGASLVVVFWRLLYINYNWLLI
jgi:hypothetical protein